MAIGPLDRSPPALFKQGVSAFSKMLVFASLSVLLMATDHRWAVTHVIRQASAVVLYPIQWALHQPSSAWQWMNEQLVSLEITQQRIENLERELLIERTKAQFGSLLAQENTQLRQLLELQTTSSALQFIAADVSYETPNPFATQLWILKGTQHGITSGAAVMDAHGVVGQITRVYPLSAELTLLTSAGQLTPVLNLRTGQHGLLKGTDNWTEAPLRLEFVDASTDIQINDTLITSGIDGIYPVGVPVATVTRIQSSPSSTFRSVEARPQAKVRALRQVLVRRYPAEKKP